QHHQQSERNRAKDPDCREFRPVRRRKGYQTAKWACPRPDKRLQWCAKREEEEENERVYPCKNPGSTTGCLACRTNKPPGGEISGSEKPEQSKHQKHSPDRLGYDAVFSEQRLGLPCP